MNALDELNDNFFRLPVWPKLTPTSPCTSLQSFFFASKFSIQPSITKWHEFLDSLLNCFLFKKNKLAVTWIRWYIDTLLWNLKIISKPILFKMFWYSDQCLQVVNSLFELRWKPSIITHDIEESKIGTYFFEFSYSYRNYPGNQMTNDHVTVTSLIGDFFSETSHTNLWRHYDVLPMTW